MVDNVNGDNTMYVLYYYVAIDVNPARNIIRSFCNYETSYVIEDIYYLLDYRIHRPIIQIKQILSPK